MSDKPFKTFADTPPATMKTLRSVKPPDSPAVPPSTTSLSSTASSTSIPRTTSRASTSRKAGVAPERDFQRIPNSVTRHAVPERVFRGKSKQVYDYLWSVSRGAVVPSRTVRKSRKEIQKGSGLGSMVTVDAAIDHLQRVGMIHVRPAIGSLVGNEYEVFTYEESSPSSTSIPSTSSPTQNLDELDTPESSSTRRTQTVDFKEQNESPKTSFKTNTEKLDDDAAAAFTGVIESLTGVVRDLTGKAPTAADEHRWREVAEVLITELRIAAGRTTVSSVPAFLAEHLRRRLWKMPKGGESGAQDATAPRAPGSTAAPAPAPRDCPDCFGTGMHYPEGFDKGVARCQHKRLDAPPKLD